VDLIVPGEGSVQVALELQLNQMRLCDANDELMGEPKPQRPGLPGNLHGWLHISEHSIGRRQQGRVAYKGTATTDVDARGSFANSLSTAMAALRHGITGVREWH
jgi:hypothetical protein